MFYTTWYETCGTGLSTLQRSLIALEHTTANQRGYSPDLIPALLQTPAYARAVLSVCVSVLQIPDDTEETVTALLQRHTILDAPGRRFHLLIGETALLRKVGAADVMADQVRFLLEILATRENVEIGIVPLDSELVAPAANFVIPDESIVDIETVTGFVTATGAEEIASAVRTFDLIATVAAYDDGARVILNRALATHVIGCSQAALTSNIGQGSP
ncbi:hypothetical protein BOX37_08590 [Nocardia mangyaensis]|uniref:DUF5753 domain-containing protein n=1 Tax=Nocardia mangyaensis TaxID=2213200 RepID=A0A1J0VPQ5_9NOCA|nr:DUF5753 domain-containing protein [Nocardia mangyaensis]APE34021.1 hypothetical protein BOX37_08590 [Nocardia mangyaensis]